MVELTEEHKKLLKDRLRLSLKELNVINNDLEWRDLNFLVLLAYISKLTKDVDQLKTHIIRLQALSPFTWTENRRKVFDCVQTGILTTKDISQVTKVPLNSVYYALKDLKKMKLIR